MTIVRAEKVKTSTVDPIPVVTFIICWSNPMSRNWDQEVLERCARIVTKIKKREAHQDSVVLMSNRPYILENSPNSNRLKAVTPKEYLEKEGVRVEILGIFGNAESEMDCAMRYIQKKKLSTNVVLVTTRYRRFRTVSLLIAMGHKFMPTGNGLSSKLAGQNWEFSFAYVSGRWILWIKRIFHYFVGSFFSKKI